MPPAPRAANFYGEIAFGPQTMIYSLLGFFEYKGLDFRPVKDGSSSKLNTVAKASKILIEQGLRLYVYRIVEVSVRA